MPTPSFSSRNLFLSAIVALSVYVPFETVAKASLIAGVVLFVADPLPPFSRLAATASCFFVLKLHRYHRDALLARQYEEEQASMSIVGETTGPDDDHVDDDDRHGGGDDGDESEREPDRRSDEPKKER